MGIFLPLILGALLAGYLPLLIAGNHEAAGIPNLVPAFALLLGLTLWLSFERQRPGSTDRGVAIALSLLFLIPSYQIGWLILLMFSLWLWRGTKHNSRARTALLIMGLAALQPLLVTYLLKWFAAPVLAFDAWLVSGLLKLTTGSGNHTGNIIFGPSKHQLLILRGCSSVTNLGSAWMAWFALSRFRGIALSMREIAVVTVLTVTIVGMNILRLYTMAIDLDWHNWWHSDTGEQSYQLVSAALLLTVIVSGIRYVGLRQHSAE
ncbi:MAG: hypothetical protein GY703_23145 [Gammaproteobacteria bacterium]|nr:hypothetical protein [Gammaproteobacteria bacterium]